MLKHITIRLQDTAERIKTTRHHEESKPVNEIYHENIRKMIEQTEDTPALCCTYTMIKTHLIILAEKGSAV